MVALLVTHPPAKSIHLRSTTLPINCVPIMKCLLCKTSLKYVELYEDKNALQTSNIIVNLIVLYHKEHECT